jgi:hypothetical protein
MLTLLQGQVETVITTLTDAAAEPALTATRRDAVTTTIGYYLQQAGMRWTTDGAHAILDLRAVRLTDDWDAYWAFHRQRQHRRLYGSSATIPAPLEAQCLASAAAA